MIIHNAIMAVMISIGVASGAQATTTPFVNDGPNKAANNTTATLTIDSSDAELYNTIEATSTDGYLTEWTNYYDVQAYNDYMLVNGNYYLKTFEATYDQGTTNDDIDEGTYYLYDIFLYQINYYAKTYTNDYNFTVDMSYRITTNDYDCHFVMNIRYGLIANDDQNNDLLSLMDLTNVGEITSSGIYNTTGLKAWNAFDNNTIYTSGTATYEMTDDAANTTTGYEQTISLDFNYTTETDWTELDYPYMLIVVEKAYSNTLSEATGDGYAYTPYYDFQWTTLPTTTCTSTYASTTTTEIIDIPNLLWTILTMPFAFFSTAFNLTLFPNTAYQVNIGNVILSILAILILVFIIKLVIKQLG